MLSDRLGDSHKSQTGNKLLQLTIDSPCDQSMNGGRLSVAQHTHTHTRLTCMGMGVCSQGEGNTACKTTTKKTKTNLSQTQSGAYFKSMSGGGDECFCA